MASKSVSKHFFANANMALTRMEFYKEHLALASLYLPFAILSLTNGPHAIISYLHAIILQLFSLGHFLHLKEARPVGSSRHPHLVSCMLLPPVKQIRQIQTRQK